MFPLRILTLLCLVTRTVNAAEATLESKLAGARPGQTVELPAGEFRGGVAVPPGVSLKGAGYDKTILDASGAENGVAITSGSGAVISDLTVCGAKAAGVLVQGADNVTVQRVRATGGLIGVSVQGGRDVRVENVISDNNRYGIIVGGGENHTVVNCTVPMNASLGLSFPSGKGTVAFNNVVTDSAVAVNVGEHAADITLDHNLYLGLNVGKSHRQAMQRESLNDWQYVSGLDQHSVDFPVKFDGNFAVTNVFDWALDRTVSSGWGVAKLAGRVAPKTDIAGVKRPATPGLGAFETTATASRPADGTFAVPGGNGLASAGVFDPHGKLVTYLFHNAPLPAGKHRFWLPARRYNGLPIQAGNYEVRAVRGDLDWRYVGWFGNTGGKDADGYGAACTHMGFAFDNDGRLFTGNVASDVFRNLRGIDGKTGRSLWTLHGTAEVPGQAVTLAADGLLCAMRNMQGQGMSLTRIRPATGEVVLEGSQGGHIPLKDGATFTGLAALGERLCYTDTTNNAVRFGTIQNPSPTTSVAVPAPRWPSADTKLGVVWVISGDDKLVAVSPEGKIVAQAQPVPAPRALAARDGLLAVISTTTGKVHLFDSSNPADLKPLHTIGRGDGPDGRILPDRFLFQGDPKQTADIAIGPNQEIAVGDFFRIQVFGRDGKLRWTSFGIWGGGNLPSEATTGRVFDTFGFTFRIDSARDTWRPESYHRALAGPVKGECKIGGQNFVMQWSGNKLTFLRFTPDKVTPVLVLDTVEKQFIQRRDTNGDGRIDDADTAEPVRDAQGNVVPHLPLHHMYNVVQPDGTILMTHRPDHRYWVMRWPCAGLDEHGVPIYRWQDAAGLPGVDQFLSPFDWKADQMGIGQVEPRPGRGWFVCANMRSSPQFGMSPFNNGGTDVVGVHKDGSTDWVRPFPTMMHVGGFAEANGLCLAGHATMCDFHVMTDDGLGLPGFSAPSAWLDHTEATTAFADEAGKVNVLVTDCTRSCNDWYRLEKADIRTAKTRLAVKPATATLLASLPAAPPDFKAGKPPTVTVRVPQLKAPFAIDGDPQKWREAGIVPQIIITPEAATLRIEGGPRDCSVLVRLAWQGKDLYVQALKFDDRVTTHNPRDRATMQDTIEMAVNGYLEGIKFNFSLTSDLGPVIWADGRWEYRADLLSPDHAPRLIKVLESAETLAERRILEAIAGVSMADCKVQLFEAKLPIDERTYAKFENARFELKSGQEFWIGFLIDDNDVPGTDSMNFIHWPVTYGTFMPKENGARVVLE